MNTAMARTNGRMQDLRNEEDGGEGGKKGEKEERARTKRQRDETGERERAKTYPRIRPCG